LSILALQLPDLVWAEPGSTPPEIGGHRPQVSDQISGFDHRPGVVECAVQRRVLPQRAAEQLGWNLLILLVFIEQVGHQRLPDLITSFIVRSAGVR
jgi:hypothetical protein